MWMYVEAEKFDAWWHDGGVLYTSGQTNIGSNDKPGKFTIWPDWGESMPAMIHASRTHLRKLIPTIFNAKEIMSSS
jgi:hypothetical protein